jgi:hypothetical protein
MQPNSQFLNEDGSLNYAALGVEPPKHFDHGPPIIQRATPIRWFQRGNELVAETELGEVVNMLPTDLQLTGVDDRQQPYLDSTTVITYILRYEAPPTRR